MNEMVENLIDSFNTVIFQIEETSITEYERQLNILTKDVNQTLRDNNNLKELIGPNSIEVMEFNHRNHGAFMVAMFRMKSSALFVFSGLWFFSSNIAAGFSPNYIFLELKAWQFAIRKYIDGDTGRSILSVYQLLIENIDIFCTIPTDQRRISLNDDKLPQLQEEYLSLSLSADLENCLTICKENITELEDIKIWWLDVIRPTMHKIGQLYESGMITDTKVSLVVFITKHIMSTFYPMIIKVSKIKGEIIVTKSPGEEHEIGALMLSQLLEMDGWNVHYIDADPTIEDILLTIEEQKPLFLCISVTFQSNLEKALELIKRIKENKAYEQIKVFVGGQAFQGIGDTTWDEIGADVIVDDVNSAVERINRITRPKSLKKYIHRFVEMSETYLINETTCILSLMGNEGNILQANATLLKYFPNERTTDNKLHDILSHTSKQSLEEMIMKVNRNNLVLDGMLHLRSKKIELFSSFKVRLVYIDSCYIFLYGELIPPIEEKELREYQKLMNKFTTSTRDLQKTIYALEKRNMELEQIAKKTKEIASLIPICASCKKIRNSKDNWVAIESYLYEHLNLDFTHSVCPKCSKKVYNNLDKLDDSNA